MILLSRKPVRYVGIRCARRVVRCTVAQRVVSVLQITSSRGNEQETALTQWPIHNIVISPYPHGPRLIMYEILIVTASTMIISFTIAMAAGTGPFLR